MKPDDKQRFFEQNLKRQDARVRGLKVTEIDARDMLERVLRMRAELEFTVEG